MKDLLHHRRDRQPISIALVRLAGFRSVIMMSMFALVAAQGVRPCLAILPLLPKESTIRRR
jgi:hypothetical protein